MKKSFILWIAMLITCMASAQVSTWNGTHEEWNHGSGTEADPFLIENAQQLAYLAYRVNNGLDAGGGHVSNHDLHYKLMVDIDLNGSESFQWTPIGYWNSDSDYQCFGGYFNGNNHIISGMYINSSANRVGLFAFTEGVTIMNLTVTGAQVSTSGSYAGGVVGVVNSTIIIKNCGTNFTSGVSGKYAGGIVGFSEGMVTITNCYNTSSISASSSIYSYSATSSGGILGQVGMAIITNCYNTGSVSASSYSVHFSASSGSGGILGQAGTATIANCYNTGAISTSSSNSYQCDNYTYSGGILGQVSTTTITNCYNTGSVSAISNRSAPYSGGVLGRAESATINSCYNTAPISVSGGTYLGGIVGQTAGDVTNSYYVNTCGGNNTYGGHPMSSDAMKTQEFVGTLNNGSCAWEYDSNYTNSGYPILTMIFIVVTTIDASNATQSHATLHGIIQVENTSIISKGFEYKKTTDSNYQAVTVSGSGDITKTISNLIPNTLYQYRTFCETNDACGMTYGEEKTFTTLQISVTTNNASEITQTHATLNGNLNVGDAIISSQGFQYKRTTDSEYQTVNVSGSGDIFTILSNLVPNTQYIFRLFCTPQGCDPVYGQEKNFSTLAINVTTNNATGVTQTHATLNGNLNIGDANILSQGFQYKRTTDSEYQTIEVSGNGSISTTLSDLTPNTQYRFRAFCITQEGDPIYGGLMTFNTLAINVTTNNATDVTQTHATLNGNINVGDASITSQGFEYKKTSDSEYETVVVSGGGNISTTLSDLTPNTQYRFRAFCTPQEGEPIYGQLLTFNTLTINVTTYSASNVTGSSATLNGNIDAGDAEVTDKGFKYWPTNNPQNVSIISVSTTGNISATINNLAQNTYQYRAFAESEGDTYQGGIQEFEISWLNNDTIFVYDADMLHWVAEQCNSGVTFEGKCVKLMNDIELPFNVPNNMISIGSYPNYPFKGTFNGNGKHITNLYIDQPNTPYQGFFGYTLNANLYNVGLVNITASGRNYTGGMVAYAKNTHMRDCYVNGGTLFALSYCGGLVGYQEQGTNSIISGCYNTCEVTGNNYVGGLIGFSNYSTVRNSYVAGRVAAQGEPVGAIIGGANDVLMYYCYFSIDITGQTNAIGENNFKDGGEGLTNEQMRDPQFVATLNHGLVTPVWKADYEIPINNGFPIIVWQEENITSVEEDVAAMAYLSLYPNPAKDFIIIQSDDSSVSLKHVEVYDIMGRKVMSEVLNGQSHGFSIEKLPAGIYNIRVLTDNGCNTNLKLVVR